MARFQFGVVKGMLITLKHFANPKKATVQYPEQRSFVSDRYRGSLYWNEEVCIACGACERACPNGTISFGSARDEKKKLYVTQFDINQASCIYCKLCEESCPTAPKSIFLAQEYELAAYTREGLYFDMRKLTQRFNKRFPNWQNDPSAGGGSGATGRVVGGKAARAEAAAKKEPAASAG